MVQKNNNPPSMLTVMTPFPHTVEEGATIEEAKQLMYEHSFRHLPVTRDGDLVGILSDRDLKVASAVHSEADSELLVQAACYYDPYIVDAHTPLDKVVRQMAERHIGSVLITRDAKLVGIFTSTDACRILGQLYGRSGDIPDELA